MPDTARPTYEDNAMGDEADQIVLDLLERAKAIASKVLDGPSNEDVMGVFHRLCVERDMAPPTDDGYGGAFGETVH